MSTIIRDAPFGVFLAMVGVPLAMAAVAVVAGWHARSRAALVKQTKTVPVGMAEDGYRAFEGTVEAIGGETVRAPLTGAECCWYSAKVEHFTRRASTHNAKAEWRTVRSITSSAPFFIRDSTGVCPVRVYGAEVTPTDKSQWTGATLEPEDRNPPRVGPSQSTHGMVQISGGPNSHYRYSEQRIYPGDPLLVLGVYASHRFDAPDLDDLPPEPPTASATAGPATERADADGADDSDDPGTPSADEPEDPWDAADSERHDTLWAKALEVTRAEIEKGGRGQPLVITTTTPSAHVAMTEMGSQAAFMVALVPLGLAIWVVLARFS